jgi:hypothetical protein
LFSLASAARESSAKEAGVEIAKMVKRHSVSDVGHIPRYLSLPLLSRTNTDVLQFLKANNFIAAVAKDYLTVQASSVPSEPAFSSGTDLVTPNRADTSYSTWVSIKNFQIGFDQTTKDEFLNYFLANKSTKTIHEVHLPQVSIQTLNNWKNQAIDTCSLVTSR